jgi:hypothetical protein
MGSRWEPKAPAPESDYFFFLVVAGFAFGSEYFVSTEPVSAVIESLHC